MDSYCLTLAVTIAITGLFALGLGIYTRYWLPPSKFSMGIQVSAFSMSITCYFGVPLATIEGLAYPFETIKLMSTIFAAMFAASAMMFGLTQVEYLSSITPFDERISGKLIGHIRMMVIVNCTVGFILSFQLYAPENLVQIAMKLYTILTMAVGFFDLTLNAYLLYFVFRILKNLDPTLKKTFLATWIMGIVLLIIGGLVASRAESVADVNSQYGVILASLYGICSYMSLITLRRMIWVRSQSAPTSQNIDGSKLSSTPKSPPQPEKILISSTDMRREQMATFKESPSLQFKGSTNNSTTPTIIASKSQHSKMTEVSTQRDAAHVDEI